MRAMIEKQAADGYAGLGVGCSVEAVGHFDPVAFNPVLVARARQAARNFDITHMRIVSGAGRDACWMTKRAPTSMVMCPFVDGLRHNEAEKITGGRASADADALLRAILGIAGVVA